MQNSQFNETFNCIENDFEIINHSDNFEVLVNDDTAVSHHQQQENLLKSPTKYQTTKSFIKQIYSGQNNYSGNIKETVINNSERSVSPLSLRTRKFQSLPTVEREKQQNLPEIILTSFEVSPDSSTRNFIDSFAHQQYDDRQSQNDSIDKENSYHDFHNSVSDNNLERKLSITSTVSSIRSRNSSLTAFSIKRNLAMAAEKKNATIAKNSEAPIDNNQSSVSSTTKDPLDHHFPNYLKCQICHKLFKDPRTLNCLHSFCFDCLVNENFGQDSSIPFWSHPDNQNVDWKNPQVHYDHSVKSTSLGTSEGPELDSSYSQTRAESRSSISSSKSSKKLGDKRTINKSLALIPPILEKAKYIICTICQHTTEIPVGGIRQIPKNFMIVRKIDEIEQNVGNEMMSIIWCGLCFDEMPAAFHCLTCILNLCNFCKEAHERQKSTSHHQIQGLVDLRKTRNEQEKLSVHSDSSKFTLKCSLHPAFDLKLFCSNCQQIICSDCSILLHKGHKYDPGIKVVKNYLKLIKETVDRTKPLCEYTDHSISQLASSSRKINEKCNQIQNDVENFMVSYFEAVEVHQRTLIQQISRARETKMQMILDQQLEMEKRSSDAKAAVEFSQELLETGSYVEILSFVRVLLKRFEFCQKYKPLMDSKISDALHFLPDIRAPSTKAQNNIPLFGIITTQTVEPQFCSLESEGLTNLRVHKKIELLILTRDGDDVPLCHGGLIINAQLKYKENVSRSLEIQIDDKRDGTYSVSFVPEYPGTLMLSITINQRHIKDSPFTLIARTLRPHSGIYHCCTFCSSKGSKIAICACEGTMVGYKGCGHGHPGHPGRRHWSCCASVLENSECVTANQI